jgi:hypothetical protein
MAARRVPGPFSPEEVVAARRVPGPFSPDSPIRVGGPSSPDQYSPAFFSADGSQPPHRPLRRSGSAHSHATTVSHDAHNPGHRLFLRGVDREMAKQFWAERERYKDVMRREAWVECTFAPQLSDAVREMERPRSLAPENRFKLEFQRRRMKQEALRKEAIAAEIAACTFQPLTLRAASLSPYAPMRAGGVHEALYRVAEMKRKWAHELQPDVYDQLVHKRYDGTEAAPPEMSPEDIADVVERLMDPEMADVRMAQEGDRGAMRRLRSRSRSPGTGADGTTGAMPPSGHQVVDEPPRDVRPYVNPHSRALAERRLREMYGDDAKELDVVNRLYPGTRDEGADAAAVHAHELHHHQRGEVGGPAIVTADAAELLGSAPAGPKPFVSAASEHIVATSRERHLRDLFAELHRASESVRIGSTSAIVPGFSTPADDPQPQQQRQQSPTTTATTGGGRPPLPSSRAGSASRTTGGGADAIMTLLDVTIAAPIILTHTDANDLITALAHSIHTAFTPTTFAEAITIYGKRFGSRPFMKPSAATRESARQRNMARLAREAAAQHGLAERPVPRTDEYADRSRGDYEAPIQRGSRYRRPRTVERMEKLREFAAHAEVAECTFAPKTNTGQFVFVRTASRDDSRRSSRRGSVMHEAPSSSAAGHRHADAPPTHRHGHSGTGQPQQHQPRARRSGRDGADVSTSSGEALGGGVNASQRSAALRSHNVSAGAEGVPGQSPRRSRSGGSGREGHSGGGARYEAHIASSRHRGFDPARIPARTVMTAADVYRGSISEQYADGGEDALRLLGQEMMQRQMAAALAAGSRPPPAAPRG